MASDLEIAWAAGLYEGEGSCFVGGSSQAQPRVSLQMTDEDVMRRFAGIMERGNVRGYHSARGDCKDIWQWSVQDGEGVLHVLSLLWPFMGERRRQRASEVMERAAKIGEKVGFCKRGHDLTRPENLYIHKKTGKRHCRTCRREYQRGRV